MCENEIKGVALSITHPISSNPDLPSNQLESSQQDNPETYLHCELSSILPGVTPDASIDSKLLPTLPGKLPDANIDSHNLCILPEIPSDVHLPTMAMEALHGNNPDEKLIGGGVPSSSKPRQLFSDDALLRASALIHELWPSTTSTVQKSHPEFCKLYDTIKQHNLPNFLGARIPLSSGLALDTWYNYLHDYYDPLLCEYLKYGWPLGYNLNSPPTSTATNHPSAILHMTAVEDFIQTEKNYDALWGPFNKDPFDPWFRISPLMTRAKKGSNERRIIVDLSFPQFSSVNDGINPENHLGENITYSLPTIADLITQLQLHGKGAFLWKADLRRAYRQIRIDPLDSPFLGIKIGSNIYIDRCPPFGCRSSAAICQRMANGLVFIMAKENHNITAYLDDFGGCHKSLKQANSAYHRFIELAKELGLELSPHKCSPPATSVDWLGYHVDSMAMSITIPDEKMREISQECATWLKRDKASKKMIKAIAGKLIFISNCVHPGRKFLARILATLRNMKDKIWTAISHQFRADIKWFYCYAQSANGIFLCSPVKPTIEIECDSSLTGGGGNAKGYYYSWKYTQQHINQYPQIYQLEAINILVAYKTLAPVFGLAPANVVVWTDNMASSFAFHTGRTKDDLLAACARELWLQAAHLNHNIDIRHKEGALIPLADALSRMFYDKEKEKFANDIISKERLRSLPPAIHDYKFFDKSL